jgi:Uma2 family endonuclease
MATEVSRRLFTVHDYHRMVQAGILCEDDRVELIRGEILAMSPIGPRHNAAVLRANHVLSRLVEDRALVGIQGSIRLDEYNEPQPDIYLLRPKEDFYASGHAGARDLFLIIEIADSSLDYDNDLKVRLYAETGVPEYWVADIRNNRLIAYSDLQENIYSVVRELGHGDTLSPRLLSECAIPVDALLP